MKKYAFWNGKFIDTKKVGLPLNDLGLLRAYAIFDVCRSYEGQIFAFDEHYARLQRSANKMLMKIPYKKDQVKKAILVLLKKNKIKNASIRVLMTGGLVSNNLGLEKPNFYILIESVPQYPKKLYENGVKLITLEYQRPFFEAKTTNYVNAIRANDEKIRRKAFEILYVKDSKILECTTSNFFLIKKGKLITAEDGIFGGITRAKVIGMAKNMPEFGFLKIVERPVLVSELNTADEAFLTATNKGIVPVVNIDGRKIGDGNVGFLTKKLMAEWPKFVKSIIDK